MSNDYEGKLIRDGTIEGEISSNAVITGYISNNQLKITGEILDVTVIETDPHDIYDGEYEITPKTTAQEFDTNDKVMTADLKVLAIPFYETDNKDGITVYIGE